MSDHPPKRSLLPGSAQRALLLIPLVMSAALVISLLASYVNVRNVLTTLIRGQGDFILDAVRRATWPSVDPVALDDLFREQEGEGLRCLVIFDGEQAPDMVFGRCELPDDPIQAAAVLRQALGAETDEIVEIGDRVRMVRRGGTGGADGRVVRPLLVEIEPLMVRNLEGGAWRSLGIGGAASLALVIVAIGLWRLTRREEQAKESRERDRRLASLGEMAAVLAHEIRNPLASMKGHSQLLAARLEGGTPERDKADRVVREAVRLEELTSDLLSFVRSSHMERRDVDPREVLLAAAEEVGAERVELCVEGGPPRWSLDPRLVQQALTNLLRNALQASPDDKPAEASLETSADALVIRVRDHGEGIAEADRERIFEPFFTTRLRGTGLGLAVARRIAALHGGDIEAGNHPSGGAVFRMTIPRA